MPVAHADLVKRSPSPEPLTELPFPPVTKSHILNCSYHAWYPRYRSLTPKARLIPLSTPFLSYLRSDGIILPSEDTAQSHCSDDDSSRESESEDETTDPSLDWPDIHQKIKATIAELDSSVSPKLNWSAPKDATWIAATNSMDCRTPNDVYLLLKSSDFITHDLEQAFDDCEDDTEDEESRTSSDEETGEESEARHLSRIPYTLILRKTIPAFNPALEFRCFVRSRSLLCMCQRDLNYFSFLPPLVPKLRSLIQVFFDNNLKRTFPDESFAFDVYIPPPHTRVWLIDINPWAPRTDPLIFSWLEILNMKGEEHWNAARQTENVVLRLSLDENASLSNGFDNHDDGFNPVKEDEEEIEEEIVDEEDVFTPECRLINRDDPEAYSFNTQQYSAHKLPKDVVDASTDTEAGLREFMGNWREIIAKQEKEERETNI